MSAFTTPRIFSSAATASAPFYGGLGCITHKLVEVLLPKYKERMLGDAAVISVVQNKARLTSFISAKESSRPCPRKPF
jgi:hypothetical protein